jgi:histone H3/H4
VVALASAATSRAGRKTVRIQDIVLDKAREA